MDLLGDLGQTDQLTSARAEDAVLEKKVEEMKEIIKDRNITFRLLKIENQSLLDEVEMYCNETARSPKPSHFVWH